MTEPSDAPPRDGSAPPEFFTSLSHDLRSNLGVVTEVLAELRADLAGHLTDEHRLLVTLADRSLRRLRRIADMASLAGVLDAGTLELRRGPVDLVGLLRDAAAVAASLEPRREVEITCDLPTGPCPVAVDADRLARAVSELVMNALRCARRTVRLGLRVASAEALVTIEDDGEGVPEDRRAALFRRFAPRPTRSGLGMGLSIAHDLIVAHGGRIALGASTLPPGRPGTTGARFVITLPIDRAPL